MKHFTTSIRAFDPQTNEMKLWCGPNIPAPTPKLAREYCDNNGLRYCKIEGELVAEIDEFTDERIDYDQQNYN